jgi:hypothetical protein
MDVALFIIGLIVALQLVDYLKSINWKNKVLLMMSSGNFDGIDFNGLAKELKTN